MLPPAPMEVRDGVLYHFRCRRYFLGVHAWENPLAGIWNQARCTDSESIENSVSAASDPRRVLMTSAGVSITFL